MAALPTSPMINIPDLQSGLNYLARLPLANPAAEKTAHPVSRLDSGGAARCGRSLRPPRTGPRAALFRRRGNGPPLPTSR